MPSDYLTDLIDHKERVARYQYFAASILLEKTAVVNSFVVHATCDGSNLFTLFDTACQIAIPAPPSFTDPLAQFHDQARQIVRHTAYVYLSYSQKTGIINWRDFAAMDLFRRAAVHDNSKFAEPEYSLYEQAFPALQKAAYGSEEFANALATIQPAIDHHYQFNDHHPQHFPGGLPAMNAIQAIEMCCDWLAASERSQKDIREGLKINQRRFDLDDQLTSILGTTITLLQQRAALVETPWAYLKER